MICDDHTKYSIIEKVKNNTLTYLRLQVRDNEGKYLTTILEEEFNNSILEELPYIIENIDFSISLVETHIDSDVSQSGFSEIKIFIMDFETYNNLTSLINYGNIVQYIDLWLSSEYKQSEYLNFIISY